MDFSFWARGRDVLEIGYGQGTDLMQLAKAGAKSLTGVDLSPTHQRIARRRFALAGREADLRITDAEALPFPSASFDLVYSFGVIHHTSDTQAVIDEARRACYAPVVWRFSQCTTARSLYSLAHLAFWLRKGWFREETMDESYWRIEDNASAETGKPLVKRYNMDEFRRMLTGFQSVRFKVRHYGCEESPVLRLVPHRWRGALARRFGWYLIAFCEV